LSMMSLSVPAVLTYGLMAVETGLVNWLLARQTGATETIAAYGIFSRVLPFVARRFGEGDIGAVRRGMRQITLAAAAYCIVLVTPALLLGGPRLARALAESARTADLASIALRFCPLACLVMVPFVLCRPAFEGLQRGRPGLTMAVLRYAVLTIPCAFLGMQAAAALSAEPLYGLLGGLVVASSASSAVFLAWLRRTLRGLEVRPG